MSEKSMKMGEIGAFPSLFPSRMNSIVEEHSKTVAIIGTGDFGRSLATRLIRTGHTVVMGSRRPNKRRLAETSKELADIQVTTINNAINSADIVFIAIPCRMHHTLVKYEVSFMGKILVDVSNSDTPDDDMSVAEGLANILPNATIVKGFNTLSAYALQSDMSAGNRSVYICGNDTNARGAVLSLARVMGFTAVDSGGLVSARHVEKIPHQLFTGWFKPMIVTIILFILWGSYATLRYHYLKKNPYAYTRWPVNTVNKIFAVVGITQLALCYLPGSIAALVQLINGTKYKRFPSWLDEWMKMRKQFGVFSLVFITIHCVMSVMLLNPAYYSSMFESSSFTIKPNETKDIKITLASRMTFDGEVTLLLGTIGWILMVILGIATVPAIGQLLNWKEWRFLQSYIGILALAFSVAHLITKGATGWHGGFTDFARKLTFLSVVLPTFTLFTRLLIWLPCICIPVNKIRGGYERSKRYEDVESDSQVVQHIRTVATLPEEQIYDNAVVSEPSQLQTVSGHENPAFAGTDSPAYSNNAQVETL